MILEKLKVILIAAGLAFAAGNITGGMAVWKLWGVSSQRAVMKNLKLQQQAADVAAKGDRQAAIDDAEQDEELERKAKDVTDTTADRECLSVDDARRLRELWGLD